MNRPLHRPNQRPRRRLIAGAGNNPQVNPVRLGVNPQIRVLQSEKLGDDFVHRRLPQPQRLDVARNGHFVINQRFQPGVNFILPHRPVFTGRPRHTDNVLAVPFGPPPRSGAVAVGNEPRRRYELRLLHIVRRHILAPVAEPMPQVLQLGFLHRRRLAQRGGNGFARQVVLGRPQPAGGKDDIRALPALLKRLGQLRQVVPNDAHPLQPDAQRRQASGNPAGVGVRQLAHQQFRANGDNLCVQNRLLGAWLRAVIR